MIDAAFRTLVTLAVAEAIQPLVRELAGLRAALSTQQSDRWLTRAEAARILGCSTDTIDRRVKDGSIDVRRLGTRTVRVRLPFQPSAEEIAAMATKARR